MNQTLLFFAIAAVLIFSAPSVAQQTEITAFGELKTALEEGKDVRVVIHFANCSRPESGKKTTPYPEISTGFSVDAFEYFPKNSQRNNKDFISIVSGRMDETLVSKGYMYRFLKMYIYEDQQVVIHKRQVNPLTFENEVYETFESPLLVEETTKPCVRFFLNLQ